MRRYTEHEMREMALVCDMWHFDMKAAMLRQAADMIERANSAIKDDSKDLECRHTAEYILTGKRP